MLRINDEARADNANNCAQWIRSINRGTSFQCLRDGLLGFEGEVMNLRSLVTLDGLLSASGAIAISLWILTVPLVWIDIQLTIVGEPFLGVEPKSLHH